MKSNLDSMYQTDDASEKEGVWFQVDKGVRFMLKRFGGKNSSEYKKAMAKHFKPWAGMIQKGIMADNDEALIMNKIFVDVSFVTWEGVVIDDKEVPYSKEAAISLLTRLPDLAEDLIKYATDVAHFKAPREDLGNS